MRCRVIYLVQLLFCITNCISGIWSRNLRGIQLVHKWKYAELEYPPVREFFIAGYPNYIKENNIIYGIAHDVINDVLYATVPRSAPGVPATLLVIKDLRNVTEIDPKFTPFPNLEINTLKKCDYRPRTISKLIKRRKSGNSYRQIDYSHDSRYDSEHEHPKWSKSTECNTMERLVSIYEPVIDKCGRLWVLDTGILEYITGDVVVKNPQLWVFNVKRGPESFKLIRRFDFPQEVIKDGAGLSGLAVDIVNRRCEDTFVYIPNQIDDRIVVYDYFKHDAWFFENYSFDGDATEANFNHDGLRTNYVAGVSSIAIGPEEEGPGHFRTIYYTAGASTGEYSISSRDLRSRKRAPRVENVILAGHRGTDSQTMAHVFDEVNGVLFYAESQTGRVRCWNSQKPLRPDNVVTIFESQFFVYGSHISTDPLGYLWFLSNRYPLFKAQLLDYRKSNIRLYKGLITDIISGTPCELEKDVELTLTEENIGQYFNITEVIFN